MALKNETAVKDQVKDALAGLSRRSIRRLLDVVMTRDDIYEDVTPLVRRSLVEHLNALRPAKARRLFTMLLEPFLVGDRVLMYADAPVPFVVQRIDAGVVWSHFRAHAFPRYADTVQQSLEDLAKTALIDEVLRCEQAMEMLGRLCEHAVDYLDDRLGRRATGSVLADLNELRASELRRLAIPTRGVRPLMDKDLENLRSLLMLPFALKDWLTERMTTLNRQLASPDRGGDPIEAISDAVESFRLEIGRYGVSEDWVGALPGLLVLSGQHHESVAHYLRRVGLDINDYAGATALLTEFSATCRAASELLAQLLRVEKRIRGASISVPRRDRGDLEAIGVRLLAIQSAMMRAGVTEEQATEPTHRRIWGDFCVFVAKRLLPVLGERLNAAMVSRHAETIDLDDVLWLVDYINRINDLARGNGLELTGYASWRADMLEDIRVGARAAVRVDRDENPLDRKTMILRTLYMLFNFGGNLSEVTSVSSKVLVDIGRDILMNRDRPNAEEKAFLAAFLPLVKDDLARTKHWKNPELVVLLDLARERQPEK